MQVSRTAESKTLGTGYVAAIQQKFLARKASLERRLGEPLTISGLTGPLRIFQRLRGHRHSIDDALTAWYALQKYPGATRYLDLGSGVGTVGMIVLWGLAGSISDYLLLPELPVSFGNLGHNELISRIFEAA